MMCLAPELWKPWACSSPLLVPAAPAQRISVLHSDGGQAAPAPHRPAPSSSSGESLLLSCLLERATLELLPRSESAWRMETGTRGVQSPPGDTGQPTHPSGVWQSPVPLALPGTSFAHGAANAGPMSLELVGYMPQFLSGTALKCVLPSLRQNHRQSL